MNAIVLHVELTLNPGHRDAYLARALQHRDNVRTNEPAWQRFEISIAEENPNLIRLYEVYADEAAVKHHMQTAYMVSYREDTARMIADRKLTRAQMAHD
ncbi:MAG: hypothetical protein CFH41_02443 [Alphaproteobacteria bacterium MarineAlpha11_Bin1]|nr:MAG: hypothetical protein CFH41_02443 [Alphaproteobacteria bacterium MarineAlpha11_Bin1]|tara:strand:- start:66 stop:362 length:297 start_codon:yes stop_codon:yes gene_type:complete